MKRFLLCLAVYCLLIPSHAEEQKQYNASLFGIRSDGVTLNTRSIQKAIDWISENGGGQLNFWVGRYLTGSIHLRSNVTLNLLEGAVIVGSVNPYDYDMVVNRRALIIGDKVENINIIGKGNIHGNGRELANNFVQAVHAGILKDDLKYDRTSSRPVLLYLRECRNVRIEDITLRDACDWVQTYDQCENVEVRHIFVESCAFWNNDGIDIVDCKHFLLEDSYVSASDDAICLKSHHKDHLCQDVTVRHCVARSSASAIKFGTMGVGGFRNIRIIGNKVYDTHRSAITVQSVDGGICEDILVDSLYATNTSNAIYLVVGQRRGEKPSSMKGVTIRNLYCEIADGKADAGYDYEGPVEDNPRNASPAGIIGLKGSPIRDVTLENITIIYPSGGDRNVAYVGLDELDKVPEMPTAYPEFSQHKELPAWGFFIRHVDGIRMKNIHLSALKKDYRTSIVLDDVQHHDISGLDVKETDKKKEKIFERK